MYYLWYSPKAEKDTAGMVEKISPLRDAFDDARAPEMERDNGFVVYKDDRGRALKVTLVSKTADHGSGWKDIAIVGTADNPEMLVAGNGTMTAQGRAFCWQNGIEAETPALLDHIEDLETFNVTLRKPLKAGRAIRLKK